MPYYQRIRDLQEDADLKQKQLCAVLRCSQQTYSDYKCGKTDIPTEALILLADFYNTSTENLLGRTDNPSAIKLLIIGRTYVILFVSIW